MTRTVTVDAHVLMDYPKDGEVITSRDYTLRFSASDETRTVEVSIDGGPFQACRQASGHFWFDWSNYMSGRHEIVVRARLSDGQLEKAPVRRLRVELDD